ncbi:uncharacterized protein LOC130743863 [Lotus japonicus]|uniref:uncharacterized protein LOC130743863 n=1 Tax=Lotus japonicus TaxID=34305 RepID=UPI00258A93B0|nr:uncharacterized protein LOC130743863 [Lotus japonicus]
MMYTLLHTDLRFGVIYTDAVTGTAEVGCVGEVIKHERLVDDRFFLICKGQERFRVTKLVRTKPYLVAQVTWLEDRPSPDADLDLDGLASEVETYMKDVIQLSNRLGGKPEKEVGDLRRKLEKRREDKRERRLPLMADGGDAKELLEAATTSTEGG